MNDNDRPQPIAAVVTQLERRCPSCGAAPGQLCSTVAGVEMTTLTHPSRATPSRGTRRRPRTP